MARNRFAQPLYGKIIYIYETYGGIYGGVSISPYYVMDANNNPVIAVYNGDD